MNVQIGIIGAGKHDAQLWNLGHEVGRLSAQRGWTVICGGLGGVMESVSKGARGEGGLVVGLLPGESRGEGNPHLTVSLPTNMGHGRNVLIAQAADVLIAIGGGYGTLSEMALGLKMQKPVISLQSWVPDDTVITASNAAEAVAAAESALKGSQGDN